MNQVHQVGAFGGFEHPSPCARAVGLIALFFLAFSGQREDGREAELLSSLSDGLDAVHLGHVDVLDDVWLEACMQFLRCLFAVCGNPTLNPLISRLAFMLISMVVESSTRRTVFMLCPWLAKLNTDRRSSVT